MDIEGANHGDTIWKSDWRNQMSAKTTDSDDGTDDYEPMDKIDDEKTSSERDHENVISTHINLGEFDEKCINGTDFEYSNKKTGASADFGGIAQAGGGKIKQEKEEHESDTPSGVDFPTDHSPSGVDFPPEHSPSPVDFPRGHSEPQKPKQSGKKDPVLRILTTKRLQANEIAHRLKIGIHDRSNLMYKCGICDEPVHPGKISIHMKKCGKAAKMGKTENVKEFTETNDDGQDHSTESDTVDIDQSKEKDSSMCEGENETDNSSDPNGKASSQEDVPQTFVNICDAINKSEGKQKKFINSKAKICFPHDDGIYKYECTVCGMHMDEYQVKKHMLEVHGSKPGVLKTGPRIFYCEFCGKSMKGSSSYKHHLVTQHDASAPYLECEHCMFKTKCKHSFNKHVKLLHSTDFKMFVCEICGYSTKYMSQIWGHKKDVHENNGYPCKWPGCNKIFKREYSLKAHTCIHTGKKLLKCSECDYECIQQASLQYHLKKHHPGVPYVYTKKYMPRPQSQSPGQKVDKSHVKLPSEK